jgi:hypothetical protein
MRGGTLECRRAWYERYSITLFLVFWELRPFSVNQFFTKFIVHRNALWVNPIRGWYI